MKKSLVLVTMVSVLAACGRTANDQEKDSLDSSNKAALLLEDEELAAAASDMLSEASDAAEVASNDDQLEGDASSSALNLAAAGRAKFGQYERSCEEVDNTAVVKIERDRSHSRFAVSAQKAGRVSQGFSESLVRTWSKEGASVLCANNQKQAEIDPKNMDGLKLVVQFSREHSKEVKAKASKRSQPVSSQGQKVANGTRTIVFSQVPVEPNALEFKREKVITLQSERTFSHANAQDQEKLLHSKLSTVEGAPLKIVALIDAASLEVKERTMESGKILNIGIQGRGVTTEYKNVRFVKGDGCFVPVSGSVEGLVQKEGKEDQSFSIEFLSAGKALCKITGKEDREISTDCAQEVVTE